MNTQPRTRTIQWQDPRFYAPQALHTSGLEFTQMILNSEIPLPPMGQLMGVEMLEAEKGRVVFGATPAEFHYNPIGTIHGGFAATLADFALSFAIYTMQPKGSSSTTIELHINYLRPMTAATGPVRCEAHAIHVGRQMGTAEAKITDTNGKIYGHATTTCLVYPMSDVADTMPQVDNRVQTRTVTWQDPMLGASKALTMSGLDYMQAFANGDVPKPPIGELTNLSDIRVAEGEATFCVVPAEYHNNVIGVAHGGLAATLCDSALGCSVHTTLPQGVAYTTAELKVNYLRPITTETGELCAKGKVIHSSRRVAIAEAHLTDSQGKLYAHGTTTCLLFPLPGH